MAINLKPEDKEKLKDDLAARIPKIRTRREAVLDERWRKNHGAWLGTSTRSFFRSDTFNHFVPALRKAIERSVVRGAQMMVPSSQFFEVYPVGEGTDEDDDERGKRAESVVQFFLYLFRKRIRPYSIAKQLLRSYFLFGRAVAKPGLKIDREGKSEFVWPNVRVVDARAIYIFPETVSDINQAIMVIEDMYIPWETYQSAVDAKVADKVEQKDLTAPKWPAYIEEQLGNLGMSTPSDLGSSDDAKDSETEGEKKVPPQDFLFISEVWMRTRSSWWFVWLLWNVNEGPKIVRVSKEVFSRPNYRIAINREMPSEQYTTTMADDLEPLQVLFNDQLNLTMEGQAMNFAPPVAVDINAIGRFRPKYQPRAIWFGSKDAYKFMQPNDTTRSGYQSLQFTSSLIDSYSGSNPLTEGQPTRNLPRAGFAVSSLLNLALADIKDSAQAIEDDILTPLLGDLYRLTVDFIPSSQIFKIPGTEDIKPRNLTTDDIAGEHDLIWVGSLQSQDFQVRAQRLLSLVETLGSIQGLPQQLAAQGKKINWVAIAKRLWREGLGERGADSIISDMTDEERLQNTIQQITQAMQSGLAGSAGAGGPPGPTPQPPADQEDVNQGVTEDLSEGEV